VLRELTAPSMALRDYATLMIVLSDNTATNFLIDIVGMEKVNARMRALGLPQTRLRRRMIDLEAARRGDENVSTPAEIAKLLQVLYRGEGLSSKSHDAAIAILQKEKTTPMRRGIPSDIPVANKPGSLEGVAVDAGIVYLKNRPYVFSAMTTFLDSEEKGDAAITAASRATFEYFSRLAHASDYGRAIR
jgi:beta-lactamase class A